MAGATCVVGMDCNPLPSIVAITSADLCALAIEFSFAANALWHGCLSSAQAISALARCPLTFTPDATGRPRAERENGECSDRSAVRGQPPAGSQRLRRGGFDRGHRPRRKIPGADGAT